MKQTHKISVVGACLMVLLSGCLFHLDLASRDKYHIIENFSEIIDYDVLVEPEDEKIYVELDDVNITLNAYPENLMNFHLVQASNNYFVPPKPEPLPASYYDTESEYQQAYTKYERLYETWEIAKRNHNKEDLRSVAISRWLASNGQVTRDYHCYWYRAINFSKRHTCQIPEGLWYVSGYVQITSQGQRKTGKWSEKPFYILKGGPDVVLNLKDVRWFDVENLDDE